MSELLTQTEARVREAAAMAVDLAARSGAQARASAHHEGVAKIVMRGGEIETAERSGMQGLSLTVFHDGKQGSASTSAFDKPAIERVVAEALLIAEHVRADADAIMPASDLLAYSSPSPKIFETSPRSPDFLLDAAQTIDRTAGEIARTDSRLRTGECAAVGSEGLWALATSDGFCRSVKRSNDARWSVFLAQDGDNSLSAFCQSQERMVEDLLPADVLTRRAANRALQALNARPVASQRCPVLFDPRTAAGLVAEFASALTGQAQYRKMSFLAEPLGRQIAASHLQLEEDPFEPLGLASAGFDSEGIAGSKRAIVRDGIVEGLFLSTFTGRKLAMPSTGNADGFYNLRLASSAAGGDWQAMLDRLGTGLVVTEIQGGKTDPASGNWTHAVKGLWVENGSVAHAVSDVTLASTMPSMLRGILAVGDDVERQGAIRNGSILIDEMQVGGRA